MITTPTELNTMVHQGKVGLTSGCFDLLHFYHLHYLVRCKAQCDYLVVGVDSDDLLTEFKAKAANVPEYHRAAMVEALKCVDAVFIMRSLADFGKATECANVVFKNSDILYGRPIIGASGKLVVIPDVVEVTSTTALVEKIRSMSPKDDLAENIVRDTILGMDLKIQSPEVCDFPLSMCDFIYKLIKKVKPNGKYFTTRKHKGRVYVMRISKALYIEGGTEIRNTWKWYDIAHGTQG